MAYNAFVGFRTEDELKIWYNKLPFQDDDTGWAVLNTFKNHSNEELKRIFLHGIRFEEFNRKDDLVFAPNVFGSSFPWNKKEKVGTIPEAMEYFQEHSVIFSTYAFIFDLDRDCVDVYRSHFSSRSENSLSNPDSKYYYNLVFTMTRENIEDIEILSENDYGSSRNMKYYEKYFLEQLQKQKEFNLHVSLNEIIQVNCISKEEAEAVLQEEIEKCKEGWMRVLKKRVERRLLNE